MLELIRKQRSLRLFTAFAIGIIFGFLLQKGGATDFRILVNQLLLRDFAVLKIIFSAIVVGSVGFYFLKAFGVADPSIKPFSPAPIVIGGLMFGVGFALLGYCPGTMAGAVGAGSLHALFGVVGIVLGAIAFARVYPRLEEFLERSNRGSVTIPELVGTSQGKVIIILTLLVALIMILLEINGL